MRYDVKELRQGGFRENAGVAGGKSGAAVGRGGGRGGAGGKSGLAWREHMGNIGLFLWARPR